MKKTVSFILALFLVPWVLTSCASKLSVKTLAPTETVAQSEKEALIFGKLIFMENHKKKIPSLTLFHKESGKQREGISVERDGTFYWLVPRGTYIIRDICPGCGYVIQPHVSFQVPPEGGPFYLGTLKINVLLAKLLWENYPNDVATKILDESYRAKEALGDRNPGFVSYKAETNLMKQIPFTWATWEEPSPSFILMPTGPFPVLLLLPLIH
jgi:hypothetical protein